MDTSTGLPTSPAPPPVWARRAVILAGVFAGASVAATARPAGACKCVAPQETAELELTSAVGSSAMAELEAEGWPTTARLSGYDDEDDDSYDSLFFYVPSEQDGEPYSFRLEARREMP